MAAKQLRELLAARPRDGRFRMADVDPDGTPGLKRRSQLKSDLDVHQKHLFNLQERLYAEHKRALLIVLQRWTPAARTARSPT